MRKLEWTFLNEQKWIILDWNVLILDFSLCWAQLANFGLTILGLNGLAFLGAAVVDLAC